MIESIEMPEEIHVHCTELRTNDTSIGCQDNQ